MLHIPTNARSRGQKSHCTSLPVSTEIVQQKASQVCKPWKPLFFLRHFSLANPSECRFFSATRLFTSGRTVASLPNAMPRQASLNLLLKSLVEAGKKIPSKTPEGHVVSCCFSFSRAFNFFSLKYVGCKQSLCCQPRCRE